MLEHSTKRSQDGNISRISSGPLIPMQDGILKGYVTFPKVREGVLSINSQIVLAKTFLSKRFSGIQGFYKVK